MLSTRANVCPTISTPHDPSASSETPSASKNSLPSLASLAGPHERLEFLRLVSSTHLIELELELELQLGWLFMQHSHRPTVIASGAW